MKFYPELLNIFLAIIEIYSCKVQTLRNALQVFNILYGKSSK